MYIAWYGKIKQNLLGEFFKFWSSNDNIEKFKATLTDGMKLAGIYFVILQTDNHDVEFWYEMDNWEVLDRDRLNSKHFEVLPESLHAPYEWRRVKVMRSPNDAIAD